MKRFYNLVNRNHRKWKALSHHRKAVQLWIVNTVEGKLTAHASLCPLACRVDHAPTDGKSRRRKRAVPSEQQQQQNQKQQKDQHNKSKRQQNEKPKQQEKQLTKNVEKQQSQPQQKEVSQKQQGIQQNVPVNEQQCNSKQQSKKGKQPKAKDERQEVQQSQTTVAPETTKPKNTDNGITNGNGNGTPPESNNPKGKQKSKRKSQKSESEKAKLPEPQIESPQVTLAVGELHIDVSSNGSTAAAGAVTPHTKCSVDSGVDVAPSPQSQHQPQQQSVVKDLVQKVQSVQFVASSEDGTAKKYDFDVIKPLAPRARVIRRRPGLGLLPRDIEYCLHMMETYGDNYEAMAADERNVYMDDASALARKIRIFRDSAHYRDYVASRSATPQPLPLQQQQQHLVT